MKIELARIVPLSEVNGPGKRAVIWVQGCPKRCSGCWNPGFLKYGSDWRMSPSELVNHIRRLTHRFSDIEGVTFSGGEPFEQAEALAKTAKLFRQHGLSVMSYSGYTKSEIVARGHEPLLEQLDILVDGEFVEALGVDRLWRSSSNQTVHFLSPRYASYRCRVDEPVREFEIVISGDEVRATGFPNL